MSPEAAAGAGTRAATGRGTGAEPISAVTLEQFLEKLPPELTILHDGGNGSGVLRWVEPSELEDPTPYLLDGEFLLTAGLPFVGEASNPAWVDAYVRRLVGAGVGPWASGWNPTSTQCRRHW
ncbi:hypothetical protein AHiyo4_12890 [Arthrobacter sp. Hiyo4]|nr:hypothetical protein AHiyo4_12890 [Arthrobacter sp. Hiyo4]